MSPFISKIEAFLLCGPQDERRARFGTPGLRGGAVRLHRSLPLDAARRLGAPDDGPPHAPLHGRTDEADGGSWGEAGGPFEGLDVR